MAVMNESSGARIRFTSVPPEVAGFLEGLRNHTSATALQSSAAV
jgi:hypothetical protein